MELKIRKGLNRGFEKIQDEYINEVNTYTKAHEAKHNKYFPYDLQLC